MNALFTLSYWLVLVTVIPGLATMATVYAAIGFVHPELLRFISSQVAIAGEWLIVPVAVTIMILTQAFGILLEEVLVRKRLLGRTDVQPYSISAYAEYSELYFLLARLTKDHDSHGHLRRAVAQFFLSLNSLVSFGTGMLIALLIASLSSTEAGALWGRAVAYTLLMLLFTAVTYLVTTIRFREMAKSIWAARTVAHVERTMGSE